VLRYFVCWSLPSAILFFVVRFLPSWEFHFFNPPPPPPPLFGHRQRPNDQHSSPTSPKRMHPPDQGRQITLAFDELSALQAVVSQVIQWDDLSC
jgi:hypothetical protein